MVVLRALNGGTSDAPRPATSILDSCLLQALPVAGCAPSFSNCTRCCVAGPRRAFSAPVDGVVYERCPAGAAPTPETMASLAALLEDHWSETRQVPDHVACKVSGITSAFVASHLDRNLRSLAHVER